jgi:ribosome-associated translation inhibitor RaiA
MEIDVRAHSIELKKGERAYAADKINKAVEKVLGGTSARIDVEISDLSQGSGAHLKRVAVHVHVPHSKTEVVRVDDPSVTAAVDLAADRIFRALKRNVERRRGRRHVTGNDLMAVRPPEPDETAEFSPTPPPGG